MLYIGLLCNMPVIVYYICYACVTMFITVMFVMVCVFYGVLSYVVCHICYGVCLLWCVCIWFFMSARHVCYACYLLGLYCLSWFVMSVVCYVCCGGYVYVCMLWFVSVVSVSHVCYHV